MSKNRATGQDELFTIEDLISSVIASVEESMSEDMSAADLAEDEPTVEDMASAAEIERVVTSYSDNEWMDVLLDIDTHTVGLSRNVAAERVLDAKRKARNAEIARKRQATIERNAQIKAQAEKLTAQRTTKTYVAMDALMSDPELTSRGVVMTLTGRKVTVESVVWSKAERKAITEVVATFTYSSGLYKVSQSGGKRYSLNHEQAITFFLTELPERPQDLMPRKYRDVMRTHRHKNMAPSDVTGNRAVRKIERETNDILSAADTELYPEYAQIEGPRLKTTGKRSRQGERGMTADERRAADRERLREWRKRKAAEKLAAEQASA